MNHLSSDQVWAYLDNDMTSEEQTSISNHLLTCSLCDRKVGDVKETAMRIRKAFVLSMPPSSSTLHEQVLTSLSGLKATKVHPKARSPRRKRIFPIVGTSVAAVVLAVVSWSVWQGGGSKWMDGFSGRSPSQMGLANSIAVLTNSKSNASAAANAPSASRVGIAAQGVSGNALTQTPNHAVNAPTGIVSLAEMGRDTLTGASTVTVTDHTGLPIAGAHVAYVVSGRILYAGTTDGNGRVTDTSLTVPVDNLSATIANGSNATPEGDAVVLVWKTGYEPVVSYDVHVFAGGEGHYDQTIALVRGNQQRVNEIGYGYSGDSFGRYSSVQTTNWLDVIESSVMASSGSSTSGGVANLGDKVSTSQVAKVSATVVDENGAPVSGAHVAVVTGSSISGWTVTDSSGAASAIATEGTPDWRLLGPWVLEGGPKVAAIVVWKDGYAPAVGLYQPVTAGTTRAVNVKLQSVAWRKSQGWTNLTEPSAIAGDRLPTEADAQRLFTWVSQASQ